MKFKTILLSAIVLACVAFVGFALLRVFSGPEDTWLCQDGTWVKHGNPRDPQPSSGCGPITPRAEENEDDKPNFTKSGYLIKNNPGLKPNVWYLSYEEAGSPGSLAELKFASAPDSGYKVGDKVVVTGIKAGSVLTVSEMRKDLSAKSDPEDVPTRVVKLFYYNSKNDMAANANNPSCESQYVLPVERKIPVSETPIQDTVNQLIKGELSMLEKAAGFTTEFPRAGFELKGANLKNGVLTLDFPEIPGFTDGGSCRVNLLQAQIEKTAKQFPEVKQVEYTNILWQP